MEITVKFDLKDEKHFEVFREFLDLLIKHGFKAVNGSTTVALPAVPQSE